MYLWYKHVYGIIAKLLLNKINKKKNLQIFFVIIIKRHLCYQLLSYYSYICVVLIIKNIYNINVL